MLGSEGCLGIITSVVVKVVPLPAVSEHASFLFKDFQVMAGVFRNGNPTSFHNFVVSSRLGVRRCFHPVCPSTLRLRTPSWASLHFHCTSPFGWPTSLRCCFRCRSCPPPPSLRYLAWFNIVRTQVDYNFLECAARPLCVYEQTGVAFCRELSRISSRLGLASCRLLDNRQLKLGKAMRGEEVSQGKLDWCSLET